MLLTSKKIGRKTAASKFIARQLPEGSRMNRIVLGIVLLLVVGFSGACNSNAPVQTNVNANQNPNANTAPANVGVVTNNNGNENTSGVRPINSNNSNQAGNKKRGNGNQ